MIHIHRATIQDTKDLAQCINTIFQEDISTQSITKRLQDANHYTYLAWQGGTLAGFVDGFVTQDKHNIYRFELDLLGVMPDARRAGIAKQLITTMLSTSLDTPAQQVRALVNVSNVPMHKALRHHKFSCQSEVCGLYSKQLEIISQSDAPKTTTHIIHVQTLTYTGYWLELPLDAHAVPKASSKASSSDIIGAVIPVSDAVSRRYALDAGLSLIGKYQWWHFHHEPFPT
jgi:ribosomal protein S18 acetylase RimI-like enzyme